MTRCLGGIRNERGITYLFLMFSIILIGLTTTVAAKQWKAMIQRELEADLLTKGIEIQNALAQYSATMKLGRVMLTEVYPQSLAELTRLPKPFLRKVYLDPMTRGEWEYLKGPAGGIMGVRSRSVAEPFRKHEFPQVVRHFDGRKRYRDWIFQHPNASTVSALPFAPLPGQGGPGQSMAGNNFPGGPGQSTTGNNFPGVSPQTTPMSGSSDAVPPQPSVPQQSETGGQVP